MLKFLLPFAIFSFTLLKSQNGFYVNSHNLYYSLSSITNTDIDSNGGYWTGLNPMTGGNPDLLNYANGSWTTLNSPFISISGNKNNFTRIDSSGNVWLCSKNGLAKYDGSGWTTFTTANSGIAGNNVQCIAFDSANAAWIGTLSGLSHFDGITWTNYTRSNSGIASDSVFSIFPEGVNSVWLGGQKGISHFSGAAFTNFFLPGPYVSNYKINGIGKEANGNYWLSTTGYGLQQFNGSGFTPVSAFLGQFETIGSATFFNTLRSSSSGEVCFFDLANKCVVKIKNNATSYFYMGNLPTSPGHKSTVSTLFYPGTSKIITTSIMAGATTVGYISLNPSGYNGFGLSPKKGANDANYKFLDTNNISAGVTNRGDLHWDLTTSSTFVAPKGSGTSPAFVSSLWMGGMDSGGQLHVAATTFRQNGSDFWPGPLDTISSTSDSLSAWNYDKVWKVSANMIADFQAAFAAGTVQNGTYPVPDAILTWPAHGSGNFSRQLALFVDVNGNGIYDPVNGGDYPKIKGDQSIYTIFNDALAYHGESRGGLPMGAEIHFEEYSFYCPSVVDSLRAINNLIYKDYVIINRSVNDYDSVYFGFMEDTDLGNYLDDLGTAIPAQNYVLSFNGDAYDEDVNTIRGYKNNIPIMSYAILDGPPANYIDGIDNNNNGIADEPGEKCLLTSYSPAYGYFGTPCNLSPTEPSDFYGLMKAVFPDSTHLQDTVFCAQNYPVNFINTDFPYNWNYQRNPRDWNAVLGSGPLHFGAGDTMHYVIAMVFTQDSALPFISGSIYQPDLFLANQRDVAKARDWYENGYPGCSAIATFSPSAAKSPEEFRLFPNPANEFITIDVNENLLNKTWTITDAAGRKISSGKIISKTYQQDLRILPAGLYFIIIEGENGVACKKFIRQ
jgi:hypothetical protein